MIGGYFGLLNYCSIEANHLTDEQVLQKINWYVYHGNNRVYDMIDYEWLICMEIKFADNPKVIEAIYNLKNMIAKNYLLKEKLKARLQLVNN